MIGKLRKGDNFASLVRYLTKDERGRTIGLFNLASDNPEAAASEMTVAAAQSVRTTRPVMHLSVSYAEKEHPEPEQMRADALRILSALGLSENHAVIIAHDDCNHPHFHIAANRVGSEGKAVPDSNSYAKVEAELRQIEKERGWAEVLGRNAPSPSTGQRMKGTKNSSGPHQPTVPSQVSRALLNAQTWQQLHSEIRGVGWRLDVVQARKGSGAMLTGPEGQKIGAGRIDREASLMNLRRRLGRDPETVKLTCRAAPQRKFKKAASFTLSSAIAPFLTPGFQLNYISRRQKGNGLRGLRL